MCDLSVRRVTLIPSVYNAPMSLEQEVDDLINDAVRRNPAILEYLTAERHPESDVPLHEQIDLVLDLCAGLRVALLRVAREIDATSSA